MHRARSNTSLDERALTEAAKALEPFGGFIATRSKTLAREAIAAYLAALPEPPLDEWLKDWINERYDKADIPADDYSHGYFLQRA